MKIGKLVYFGFSKKGLPYAGTVYRLAY